MAKTSRKQPNRQHVSRLTEFPSITVSRCGKHYLVAGQPEELEDLEAAVSLSNAKLGTKYNLWLADKIVSSLGYARTGSVSAKLAELYQAKLARDAKLRKIMASQRAYDKELTASREAAFREPEASLSGALRTQQAIPLPLTELELEPAPLPLPNRNTGFTGIILTPNLQRYIVRINIGSRINHLGVFDTLYEAGQAYDAAIPRVVAYNLANPKVSAFGAVKYAYVPHPHRIPEGFEFMPCSPAEARAIPKPPKLPKPPKPAKADPFLEWQNKLASGKFNFELLPNRYK